MEKVIGKGKRFKLDGKAWFIISGLVPIMILFIDLRVVPIIQVFVMSLFKWDMVSPSKPFIGFKNYDSMFHNAQFMTSLSNTTIIAFGILVISLPISLMIAVALKSKVKFKSWYEALYFLPVIAPMIPSTITWKWILDSDNGLLNYIISIFGFSAKAWLLDPNLAIFSVILISVWKTIGYNMLIFMVGLNGIPEMYYEASKIDGASNFRTFWSITLPLLKPISVFVSITTLIKGYNVFSQVYVLASDVQGAPGYLVRVLVYDMIQNGFKFFKVGYASAEAVVLFFIVLVLTFIQLLLTREKTPAIKGGKR